MRKGGLRVCLTIITAVLVSVGSVQAESAEDTPFSERLLSEFESPGISAGPFTVKPALEVGIEYNDNVFAVKDGKTYDWITTAAPRVDIQSGWARHAMGISAGIKGGMYGRERDESYVDGHAFIDGQLDMLEASYLKARAGIEQLHEERGDPDVFAIYNEPVVYNRAEGTLAARLKPGKAALDIGGTFVNLDYQSVELAEGTSQNLDHRNRDMYSADARLSYDMLPSVSPFLLYRHNWRRYENDSTDPETRDSEGYQARLGTGFDIGGRLTGEIFGGYFSQEYDYRDGDEDISGPWYGMSLHYNVSESRSIQGDVQKEIKETTMDGARGIDSLNVRLSVRSYLPGNLLETIYFDFTQDIFKGDALDADIEDRYYEAGYRIIYFWTPNIQPGFEYSYTIKDADDRSEKFSENRLQILLTGKF